MDQERFNSAQAAMGLSLDAELSPDLSEALCSPQFSGCFEPADGPEPALVHALIALAKEFSVAPISGFQVGALAVARSGRCYLGANMEFTGVPLHASLHAEQSAVINAWMHGEQAIDSLHVSELPCGLCRQFLLEIYDAAKLPIIVKTAATTLAELMPQPFINRRPKGQSLLDSPPRNLVNIHPEPGNHIQRAINAASRSYTPYSQSPEGFIIETINGHHLAGRVAESIALNPSVPAAIAALNQMNLSAQRKVSISRCTHARLATALTQSYAFSESLMRGICSTPVESVLMESVD
ncbi:MAG TPA: cytidine deaminase [Opitutales bacterium]|nr:cytidine deaminase [Opitutales bacterium]